MTICRNRMCLRGLVLALMALLLAAQPLRAQDQPGKQPPKPRDPQQNLDQARAEVCRALEQFREAEANLRQAEKRLRELEGKGAPGQDKAEGEFHIISLKRANAQAVAQTLLDLLGKDRVRIVADPVTNALLIRGTPMDLAVIQTLIRRLDVEGTDTEDQLDPHVYTLKYAEAQALAKVLVETFGKGRATIAVDEKTNSLIVRARRMDQLTIAKLIQHLDEMAAKAKPPEK